MGRHSEASSEQHRKEEKHQKHMEQLALHEKHKAKKDPENARWHRIKEEIAATVAVGSAGFAFHEHHRKKDARKHII
ncbi:hypothetical protein ZWY2020_026371 [Hordeum vulgare]|nr:hypothetical protein ZWY2020_026371 [Hordeum vulgare]